MGFGLINSSTRGTIEHRPCLVNCLIVENREKNSENAFFKVERAVMLISQRLMVKIADIIRSRCGKSA